MVEPLGPDAFSLRALARRAGVFPAAPSHHFGDARGLLTALATIGFVELGDALERTDGPDRATAIRAQRHAYREFALARPGLFRLMWRKAVLDKNNADYVAAARRAFAISDAVVRPDAIPAGPNDPALAPTIACWALTHGFVGLVIDGAFFARALTPATMRSLLDRALDELSFGSGR